MVLANARSVSATSRSAREVSRGAGAAHAFIKAAAQISNAGSGPGRNGFTASTALPPPRVGRRAIVGPCGTRSRSDAAHADVLHLDIFFDAVLRSFAPHSRLLDAAEGAYL